MATTFHNLSHFREPEGDDWDTDILPEIPTGTNTDISKAHHQPYTPSNVTYTNRTRTSSLGSVPSTKPVRTRKTSSSTRELVRVLIEENLLDTENTHAQLAHAYDVLRAESKRAAEAERVANEAKERLRGIANSRMEALKEAARAQSELRTYKLQLEAAQQRIRDANELTKLAEADKERSEKKAKELRKIIDKYRENTLTRQAKEEGVREGRLEVLRELTHHAGENVYEVLPSTSSNATILPVPPPASVLIRNRHSTTPKIQYKASPGNGFSQGIPTVTRQSITPPVRRRTPSYPIPPPVTQPVPPPPSIPVLPRQTATPIPHSSRGIPDEIIIKSPIATRPLDEHLISRPLTASSHYRDDILHPPPRPPSHASTPMIQQHENQRVIDPAVLGALSAGRIYTDDYSSDSDAETEPMDDLSNLPSLSQRQDKQWLPQQEIIIPRPAPTPSHHRREVSTVFPPSPVTQPLRDQITGPPFLRRSSTDSSVSSEVPYPRVAALRRRDGNARRMSLDSDSSVPSINIEPPTRSSSEASLATTVAGHLLPSGEVAQEPDFSAAPPGYNPPVRESNHQPLTSPHQHSRPQSRTGFRYGPPAPKTGPVIPGIPNPQRPFSPLSRIPEPHSPRSSPNSRMHVDGLPGQQGISDYFSLRQGSSPQNRREPTGSPVSPISPYNTGPNFDDETIGRPGYTPRPSGILLDGRRRKESISQIPGSSIHRPPSRASQTMFEDFGFDVPGHPTSERSTEYNINGPGRVRTSSMSTSRTREVPSRTSYRSTPFVRSNGLMDN